MPKIKSTSQNTAKQKYANYLTKLIIFMIVSGIIMMVLASVYYSHFNKSPNITPVSYPKQSLQDLQSQGIFADKVYVKKSTHTLQLLNNNQVLRQYHIVLGDNPQGHKQQEGDERTPEGWYTLDWANEQSAAYRSLHVSYPNSKDRANAKMLGVSPGGAIMIHGQMNGTELLTAFNQKRDWTNGCIAVTNSEMDEIMTLVKVGTPIFIEW